MHNSAHQKLCLKGFSMQHQNMVWQDIRRWSKQNQNMGLWKHQKNKRSEATEVLMVSRNRSTSRSEDQKMLCTKLFDSDDIQTLYLQTSDQKEVQVADYAD